MSERKEGRVVEMVRTDILASGDSLVLSTGEDTEGVCTEVITLSSRTNIGNQNILEGQADIKER